MPNYALVVNNVIENMINLTDYAYENVDANLKLHLVKETPETGNVWVGGTYDSVNNIFMPTQPYNSWIFDKTIKQWVAPIPRPDEGDTSQQYSWDENTKSWVGNGIQVKRIDSNTEPNLPLPTPPTGGIKVVTI